MTSRPAAAVPWDRWKRLVDVLVASVLLVVLSPVMLVVAVLIRCCCRGPALYRQARPGLGGAPFEIVKFRSMRCDPELEQIGADADHLRITRLGRFLRATSIDELPNLLNVLRGEMSLVGPRPHLIAYLDLYSEEQARRHDVRPGVTGLAQVRGRNELDWATRLRFDVEYVDHRSARLDLCILIATLGIVLSRRGVTAPGHATQAQFRGDEADPASRRLVDAVRPQIARLEQGTPS